MNTAMLWDGIVTNIVLILVLAELIVVLRIPYTVVGSHQRYAILTVRRILSWAVNVGFILEGLLHCVTGNFLFGPLFVLLGIYFSYREYTQHKDDDDWFNGRGKKIKDGLKKRLTFTIRTTAPSFG